MSSLLQAGGRHARDYWLAAEQRTAAFWAGWTPQHRAAKHRLNASADSPSRVVPTFGGRHRAGASS